MFLRFIGDRPGAAAVAAAMVFACTARVPALTSGAALAPAQVSAEARPLSERELGNVVAAAKLVSYLRFFHPSDRCAEITSWDQFAFELIAVAESAPDANRLAVRLRDSIAGVAPTVELWPGAPGDAPPMLEPPTEATHLSAWLHVGAGRLGDDRPMNVYRSTVERHPIGSLPADLDPEPLVVELGGGVSMRLPIAVPSTTDQTLPIQSGRNRWAGSAAPLSIDDRRVRLAAVALAWGIFQHFYPYHDFLDGDWDAVLRTSLRDAATADDAGEHRDVLRRLVAELRDGHGNVFNPQMAPADYLPLALEWAGDDLVVVGVEPPVEGVIVGDALLTIDGRDVEEIHLELAQMISSATEGWLRVRSAPAFVADLATENPVRLTLRAPDGTTRDVEVVRSHSPLFAARTVGRIANGAEVGADGEGIVYFDLRGTKADDLIEHMLTLARARAIVFDLRGYPDNAAYRLIGHLITEPVQSARWMKPIVRRPDRLDWRWDESGRWHMVPLEPRIDQPIAFLTDGRAISYAESILGIIEHHRLGEIVGAPTAGTNGNVNPFTLPGGDMISWTGMKVLKHDGSPHHGVGILPTVPVVPTQAGIAVGRDEVLEEAVAVLRRRLAETKP